MQHETISADDGEQLHVRLSGSGTPILLLHGWTSSHAAWAPPSCGARPSPWSASKKLSAAPRFQASAPLPLVRMLRRGSIRK